MKKSYKKLIGSCIALLDEAEEALSRQLSSDDRSKGWTESKQAELRRIVQRWQGEISNASSLASLRPKILGRWFLDNGVSHGPISELLASVDNMITECQKDPEESLSDRPSLPPRSS
jgi:hypothetical protein